MHFEPYIITVELDGKEIQVPGHKLSVRTSGDVFLPMLDEPDNAEGWIEITPLGATRRSYLTGLKTDRDYTPCRKFFGLGSDIECCDGVLMDADVYHEGWHDDVIYPPCPCNPKFCKACNGSGQVEVGDHLEEVESCTTCEGTGWIGDPEWPISVDDVDQPSDWKKLDQWHDDDGDCLFFFFNKGEYQGAEFTSPITSTAAGKTFDDLWGYCDEVYFKKIDTSDLNRIRKKP